MSGREKISFSYSHPVIWAWEGGVVKEGDFCSRVKPVVKNGSVRKGKGERGGGFIESIEL